jgi:hypothetical protein
MMALLGNKLKQRIKLSRCYQFLTWLLMVCPALALAQTEWKLVKDVHQIQIYVKDIPGSNLKELKTIAQFDCSMDALLSLLIDISAQPKHQFACMQSKRVNYKNNKEQYFYQTLDMPWPISNRDGIFRQVIGSKSNDQIVYLETNSEKDFLPIDPNFVRVPSLHSNWVIKKTGENKLIGEYTIKVDPGGMVPAWLVNLFIDKAPYESVLKMRKLLQEAPYKDAYIKWLHP